MLAWSPVEPSGPGHIPLPVSPAVFSSETLNSTQPWDTRYLLCPVYCHPSPPVEAQMVKNLVSMQETGVRSLGREDPLE